MSYYYTRDHLGSVRELVNSSGAIVARYDYDPYGRTTVITGTVPSDFQYAGYYTHATSGLNLTMFRAYDPNTARWLSRDPLGEGSDATLYSYVWNDPLELFDPLGLGARGEGPHGGGGGGTDTAAADAALINSTEADIFNFIDSFSLIYWYHHPATTAVELGVGKPVTVGIVKGLQGSSCPAASATGNVLAQRLPQLGLGLMIGATIYDYYSAPQPPPPPVPYVPDSQRMNSNPNSTVNLSNNGYD